MRVNLPSHNGDDRHGGDTAKGGGTRQSDGSPPGKGGANGPRRADRTLSDVDNWGAFRAMLHGRIALVHALDEGDPNGRAEIILDALMEETGGVEGVCIGKLSVPKSALLLVRSEVQ